MSKFENYFIRCYHPPVNIIHLADYIYVPKEDVYTYTKKLYGLGIEHKATPPQREHELQEFFRWKVRYMSCNGIVRWIIDWLM